MTCDKTITATEPAYFEYTAWAFDHRDKLASVLDEAGASDYFVRFVMQAKENTRHSVLMTLFRHHGSSEHSAEEADEPNVEACEEAYRLGGSFFTKLWDGDLADAYCHSDGNNQPMMEDTFSQEEIVSVGLQNNWNDREYLSGLVEERWG